MFLWPILSTALLGALIGYAKYIYRNKVACTQTSISSEFTVLEGRMVRRGDGQPREYLTSQRILIQNSGFRNLENVELHIPAGGELIYSNVKKASSISPTGVVVAHSPGMVRVSFPTLPRSEEVVLEFATTSIYESEYRDIRGTGSNYRVVEGRRHKLKRDFIYQTTVTILLLAGAYALWFLIPLTKQDTSASIVNKAG